MSHYAGVDVGGTKVLCVVLDIEGKTVAQHKVKVGEDKSVVSVLAKVREAYAGALAAAGLAGVAGVVRSPLTKDKHHPERIQRGWPFRDQWTAQPRLCTSA